jgi:anti-anti-sigma factor
MTDLQIRQQGEVLSLGGRLTGTTTAALEQWLAAHAPVPRVWDLSRLGFISSAGLRVMVVHEKQLRQQGGSTLLVGMTPAVKEVFRITGLATFWPQAAELPAGAAAAAPPASPAPETSVPITQTATGVRYRLEPTTAAGGPIVQWDAADWRGASVQELGLAFGRGGLGARRELAAAQPMAFAAAVRSLSLQLEDGECDVLPIADPAGTFVRIERAWSMTGAPAATVRLLDDADQAALSDIVRAATGAPWNAVMLLVPATAADAPTRVVLAVLPPGADATWSGCTLRAPQLAAADRWSMSGLLERLPECLVQGDGELLVPAVPARIASGAWIYVWGADVPTHASTQTLALDAPVGGLGNGDETELITRALYAGCRRVTLTPLTGGFSAATWQVESVDEHGRRLLPTVLKVGTPAMMNREHAAHERYVRPFILNNATVGLGHAAQGDAVGLRYNFLGVTGDGADLQTLARRWKSQGAARVRALYETLALRTLQPWYGQAREAAPCLYADHTPLRLFPGLPAVAREILPFDLDSPTLFCAPLGRTLPNPWWFLAHEFPRRATQPVPCKVSITHGDLNLNNVLSDERDNLYVIDFSETRERSVGSDFARLEAALLVEELDLQDDAHEARLLRDLEALYAPDRAWHEAPAALETVPPERLAFMIQLRRLAAAYLGPAAPAEAYLLPLIEWTLPIVMFGNQPRRVRCLSTFIAALQLEKMERPRRP